MTDNPPPEWDLTDEQLETAMLFPFVDKPSVRRGECKTPVPWPWLGGPTQDERKSA